LPRAHLVHGGLLLAALEEKRLRSRQPVSRSRERRILVHPRLPSVWANED
jgi:hypothetical protein